MKKLSHTRYCAAALFLSFCTTSAAIAQNTAASSTTSIAPTNQSTALLTSAELQKLIPATVFFRGQSSTVQYRNSGGIRFQDGAILFAVKVDTGGYSTSIQERYQDYFVSEVPVQFGSHILPSGAYGLGFVGPNFLVMDLGGHTIFTVPSTTDSALHRPRPLQLVSSTSAGAYRLYSGKQYVDLHPTDTK